MPVDPLMIQALLQQGGNALPIPPMSPTLASTPPTAADDDDDDDDDDQGDDDTPPAAVAAPAPAPQGGGSNVPAGTTAPPTTLAGGSPAPAAAAPSQGVLTPGAENPTPGNAASPEAKKSIWAKFIGHFHDNPDMVDSLLKFAAAAAAPPKLGQNSLSVLSSALSNSVSGYHQAKADEAAAATAAEQQNAKIAAAQKTADARKQQADTAAQQAQANQELGKAKLELATKKYKSDAELETAKTNYFNKAADAQGLKATESGAKLTMANQMADAAIATGMFKDKQSAFLWATDSVLHTQGQTAEQMHQSMISNAIKAAQEQGITDPKELQDIASGADTTFQYLKKNNMVGSTVPQPIASPNAPVTPAPVPGGAVAAPAPAPAASPATAAPAAAPTAQVGAPAPVVAKFSVNYPTFAKNGYTLGKYVPDLQQLDPKYPAGPGYQVVGPDGAPLNTYFPSQ